MFFYDLCELYYFRNAYRNPCSTSNHTKSIHWMHEIRSSFVPKVRSRLCLSWYATYDFVQSYLMSSFLSLGMPSIMNQSFGSLERKGTSTLDMPLAKSMPSPKILLYISPQMRKFKSPIFLIHTYLNNLLYICQRVIKKRGEKKLDAQNELVEEIFSYLFYYVKLLYKLKLMYWQKININFNN